MTHIVLIHQAFCSPNEPGGTRHYELGRHLVEQGDRFTVVAGNVSFHSGQRTVARQRLITPQTIDGILVLWTYVFPALHRSYFWRIVAFFSFMFTSVWAALRVKQVDLVMGTSPPIFQAVSAWIVAALRRRPFLLEVRDLWPEFAIDIGVLKNPILIRISRWLEQFLYARATHILVNSPAYRDYLLEKGITPNKISCIPNGVDPTMFDPNLNGSSIRDELELDGKFVVTYAGALGLANDIGTVLEAAVCLVDDPTIHFLLVGDGKERQTLETQAHTLNLSNVTFTGVRPKSAMPAILAASDACVAILKNIAMFRTTYPNKVFDYMAASRPTILAIDGVIRQVIEQSGGGIFVPPGDASALADAIRTLSQHPARAREMGAAARAYVVEHFDRGQQAAQFARLVQHLTESKG